MGGNDSRSTFNLPQKAVRKELDDIGLGIVREGKPESTYDLLAWLRRQYDVADDPAELCYNSS